MKKSSIRLTVIAMLILSALVGTQGVKADVNDDGVVASGCIDESEEAEKVVDISPDMFVCDGINYIVVDRQKGECMTTVTMEKINGELRIPATVSDGIDTFRVVGIGKRSFEEQPITSVIFPNTIRSIEEMAFNLCEDLREVYFPSSLVSIGKHAFCFCDKLSSVRFPDSLDSIGDFAFVGCGLVSVYIPDGVMYIGDGAFIDNENLSEIKVDANNSKFSSVDGVLFDKHASVLIKYPDARGGTYVIPETTVIVGNRAFTECKKLEIVIIPSSVRVIETLALSFCKDLTWIAIPNSVRRIDEYAFCHCEKLIGISLPDHLSVLGQETFGSCPITYINYQTDSPVRSYENVFDSEVYEKALLKYPRDAMEKFANTAPWNKFINND